MAEHLANDDAYADQDAYCDTHGDAHGDHDSDEDRDADAHEAPDHDADPAPDQDAEGYQDAHQDAEADGYAMNDLTKEQRVEACLAYCAGDRPRAATLRYFRLTVADIRDYYARREEGGKE